MFKFIAKFFKKSAPAVVVVDDSPNPLVERMISESIAARNYYGIESGFINHSGAVAAYGRKYA